MSELEQLRQEADELRNQIRVRAANGRQQVMKCSVVYKDDSFLKTGFS